MAKKSTDKLGDKVNTYDAGARVKALEAYYAAQDKADGMKEKEKSRRKEADKGITGVISEASGKLKMMGMKISDCDAGVRAHRLNKAVVNAKDEETKRKAQNALQQFLADQGEAILAAVRKNEDVPIDKKTGQLDLLEIFKVGQEAREEALNEEDRADTTEHSGRAR